MCSTLTTLGIYPPDLHILHIPDKPEGVCSAGFPLINHNDRMDGRMYPLAHMTLTIGNYRRRPDVYPIFVINLSGKSRHFAHHLSF